MPLVALFDTPNALAICEPMSVPIAVDVAVLQDERFSYVCRLESSPDAIAADRAVLVRIVESIEPLPRPERSGDAVDPALAASWSE